MKSNHHHPIKIQLIHQDNRLHQFIRPWDFQKTGSNDDLLIITNHSEKSPTPLKKVFFALTNNG